MSVVFLYPVVSISAPADSLNKFKGLKIGINGGVEVPQDISFKSAHSGEYAKAPIGFIYLLSPSYQFRKTGFGLNGLFGYGYNGFDYITNNMPIIKSGGDYYKEYYEMIGISYFIPANFPMLELKISCGNFYLNTPYKIYTGTTYDPNYGSFDYINEIYSSSSNNFAWDIGFSIYSKITPKISYKINGDLFYSGLGGRNIVGSSQQIINGKPIGAPFYDDISYISISNLFLTLGINYDF